MTNLQLSLKKKWFEMTKSGVKTECYREITPYWTKRFFNICSISINSPDRISDFLKVKKEIYEGDIFIYNYTLDGTQTRIKKIEFNKEVGCSGCYRLFIFFCNYFV